MRAQSHRGGGRERKELGKIWELIFSRDAHSRYPTRSSNSPYHGGRRRWHSADNPVQTTHEQLLRVFREDNPGINGMSLADEAMNCLEKALNFQKNNTIERNAQTAKTSLTAASLEGEPEAFKKACEAAEAKGGKMFPAKIRFTNKKVKGAILRAKKEAETAEGGETQRRGLPQSLRALFRVNSATSHSARTPGSSASPNAEKMNKAGNPGQFPRVCLVGEREKKAKQELLTYKLLERC